MFDPPLSGAPRVVDAVPHSALIARTLARATPGLATAIICLFALAASTFSVPGNTAPAGSGARETQTHPSGHPLTPGHPTGMVYCAGTHFVGRCV
jgi:hypothetical protein